MLWFKEERQRDRYIRLKYTEEVKGVAEERPMRGKYGLIKAQVTTINMKLKLTGALKSY